MTENNIQQQIDEMNNKLDLLLHHVNEQRAKSETVEDLISDLSIIGKDVYDSTVEELDNRQVEIDPAELTELGISFLRNIKSFIVMMNTFESMMDLSKELGPIAKEVIIDVSKKLGEFEEQGYFDFLREVMKMVENILKGFSAEDVRQISENIVPVLKTVQKITQPEVMNSVDNAVEIYSTTKMEDIPEYSLWRMFKEMKSPEMKKGMGFMITLMKGLSQASANDKKK